MRRVNLIILDSGPLISFAKIDRLDILKLLNADITIVDSVWIEVINADEEQANRIQDFIKKNAKSINIYPTDRGMARISNMDKNIDPRLYKNSGELSIMDFLEDEEENKNFVDSIVVSEDRKALSSINSFLEGDNKPVCLETRGFLKLIEKYKLIDSADDIIQEMVDCGRCFSQKINNSFLTPFD